MILKLFLDDIRQIVDQFLSPAIVFKLLIFLLHNGSALKIPAFPQIITAFFACVIISLLLLAKGSLVIGEVDEVSGLLLVDVHCVV